MIKADSDLPGVKSPTIEQGFVQDPRKEAGMRHLTKRVDLYKDWLVVR